MEETKAINRDRKEYPLIDILKIFFATVVVAVHVFAQYSSNTVLSTVLDALTQVGMAFFFVASGFFAFRKYAETRDHRVFGKQALRLLMLYGIYNVIYYVVRVLVPGIINHTAIGETTLVFLREMVIGGTSVMWFIWSLLVFYGLMFFITWKSINPFKCAMILLAVGFVSYAVCFLFFDSYGVLFLDQTFVQSIAGHWAYFGLLRFFGECLFFVPLGFFIAVMPDTLRRKPLILIGLIASFACFLLEYFLVRNLASQTVCFGFAMPLFAFFGFTSAILFDKIPAHPSFRFIRNMSTAIYLIHTPIMNLMHQLFKLESVPKADGWIPFVAILALSCLYFVLINWAKRFKPFRWLRYLY